MITSTAQPAPKPRVRSAQPQTMSEFALQLISALRRHWVRSLWCFALLMLALLVFLIIVPRKYASSGKFFVRLGRGGVTLDPTATMGKNVHIQESRDAEINTVADVLGSRALLEEVVDEIGPQPILQSHFFLSKYIRLPGLSLPSFSKSVADDSLGNSEKSYDELMDRELAILELDSNVEVKASKKAATVNLRVEAGTPKLAQQIAQLMMDRYLDMHIAARKTDGSQAFFQEQLDLQYEEMVEAQEAIRDFKNQIGVTSIAGERNSIQMQLDKVRNDLIQVAVETASAYQRVKTLAEQFEGLSAQVVSARVEGNANEGADMMRNTLFSLEAQYEELSARYSATHPEVQALAAAIEKARVVVEGHPYDREEVTTAINPTKVEIEKQLLLAKAGVEGTVARRDALLAKQDALHNVLRELNRNDVKLSLLESDFEISKSNHREYAEKLEEARINEELDRGRISNVKLVQPPTLVVKAVSPRRAILFVLGSSFAFFVSIALAYVLDALDTTIRSSKDLAANVDVPVLVTLPRSIAKDVIAKS